MTWARWPFKLVVGVTLGALIGGVSLSVTGDDGLGQALLTLGVVWSLLLSSMLIFSPGRQYRRLPRLAADQTFCFGDDEVSWTFVDGASTAKWTYFEDLLDTPTVYVLRHQRKRFGQLVPKRAFNNADDQARFRRLVGQHLKVRSSNWPAQGAGRGSTPSSSKP